MSVSNIIDISSNGQKIHYLVLILPLITFLFYRINLIIISFYVILVALMSLYIHILICFKNESANSVIYEREKRPKDFWYIPYIWFFAILSIVSLFAFFYSFILTIINLSRDDSYNYFLFFAHIFVMAFDIFMLVIIRYYKILIPKLKKQGLIK